MVALGSVIATAVLCVTFLPVLHALKLGSTYEYLELRFDTRLRKLTSVMYTIRLLLLLPLVIYVPALAFTQVTGISIHVVAPAISALCVLYTTAGGLRAVALTGSLQLMVMLAATVALLAAGIHDVGGFGVVWRRMEASGRVEFFNMDPNPLTRTTFWSATLGGTFFWLQMLAVQPNSVQRYLAVPTLAAARRSVRLTRTPCRCTVGQKTGGGGQNSRRVLSPRGAEWDSNRTCADVTQSRTIRILAMASQWLNSVNAVLRRQPRSPMSCRCHLHRHALQDGGPPVRRACPHHDAGLLPRRRGLRQVRRLRPARHQGGAAAGPAGGLDGGADEQQGARAGGPVPGRPLQRGHGQPLRGAQHAVRHAVRRPGVGLAAGRLEGQVRRRHQGPRRRHRRLGHAARVRRGTHRRSGAGGDESGQRDQRHHARALHPGHAGPQGQRAGRAGGRGRQRPGHGAGGVWPAVGHRRGHAQVARQADQCGPVRRVSASGVLPGRRGVDFGGAQWARRPAQAAKALDAF
ncbi:uncharacterized protein LOC117644573 isoform X2 [Thrips palmi]|uniref:Uncharacterized protein LOC117644573 isoform X2 n=1 Tax=Thrips palmi TaxID=161013 RepID=A0A6P8Z0E6_THRPL|nr:uncharacterized protein LOC117644573 isoform X2 [Thrips palmi]